MHIFNYIHRIPNTNHLNSHDVNNTHSKNKAGQTPLPTNSTNKTPKGCQ